MFPNFNIYSTPLFILVIQGLILVGMLLHKSRSKRDLSSLILGILLLITCYHRTTYTIGFMGWYDTFRNTKINYYLISLLMGIGPLIYLYIKSIGQKGFRMDLKMMGHFIPMLLYVVFSIGVLLYDRSQSDFATTQNGVLMQWVVEHLSPIFAILIAMHLLAYLIFSFQLYYKIRSRLEHQFSNTFNFEMLWLRNFLFLFAFLFVYDSLQTMTDGFIFDLHWTQEWWYQFFSLLVVIYVGVKGYFTPLENLPLLEPELLQTLPSLSKNKEDIPVAFQSQLDPIIKMVQEDSLYLDSNITLTKLARKVKIPPSQLSLLINKGLGQNFNEFINTYRIAAVKEKLADENYNHLSILAIALDAGFNSKATFNRVFKKIDGHSPSHYRN